MKRISIALEDKEEMVKLPHDKAALLFTATIGILDQLGDLGNLIEVVTVRPLSCGHAANNVEVKVVMQPPWMPKFDIVFQLYPDDLEGTKKTLYAEIRQRAQDHCEMITQHIRWLEQKIPAIKQLPASEPASA